MSQVSRILRRATGRYFHWCPACEEMHPLPDSWKFDGNVEKPTFSPSFRQSFVRFSCGIDPDGRGVGVKSNVECHYFITDGNIQFLGDSWHRRTDIVAMPAIPDGADSFLDVGG